MSTGARSSGSSREEDSESLDQGLVEKRIFIVVRADHCASLVFTAVTPPFMHPFLAMRIPVLSGVLRLKTVGRE